MRTMILSERKLTQELQAAADLTKKIYDSHDAFSDAEDWRMIFKIVWRNRIEELKQEEFERQDKEAANTQTK